MDGTALIVASGNTSGMVSSIPRVLVTDDEPDTGESAFPEPYKKGSSAFFILFHTLRCTDDLPESVTADTNGNKDGDILNLTAPAAFR